MGTVLGYSVWHFSTQRTTENTGDLLEATLQEGVAKGYFDRANQF